MRSGDQGVEGINKTSGFALGFSPKPAHPEWWQVAPLRNGAPIPVTSDISLPAKRKWGLTFGGVLAAIKPTRFLEWLL